MGFLLATNVVSELRRGDAANASVIEWFDAQAPRELFLSVLTVGEIRQGIEQLRSKDRPQAARLDRWVTGLVQFYEDRLIHVDGDIAEEWGRLRATRSTPVVDALIAATARVHDLTLVTRNVRDFSKLKVRVLNPFGSGDVSRALSE
jgi:predicted nucleic acid-binding protein